MSASFLTWPWLMLWLLHGARLPSPYLTQGAPSRGGKGKRGPVRPAGSKLARMAREGRLTLQAH